MRNSIFAFMFGIAFTLASIFAYYKYITSDYGQVQRCMDLYLSNGGEEYLNSQPDIVEQLKKEGFDSVRDGVKDRCQHWIRNGQKF